MKIKGKYDLSLQKKKPGKFFGPTRFWFKRINFFGILDLIISSREGDIFRIGSRCLVSTGTNSTSNIYIDCVF